MATTTNPSPITLPDWASLPPDLGDAEIRALTTEVVTLNRRTRALRREFEAAQAEAGAAKASDVEAQARAYRDDPAGKGSNATPAQTALSARIKALHAERTVAIAAMTQAMSDIRRLLKLRGGSYAADARSQVADLREKARRALAEARDAELVAETLLQFAKWSESAGTEPANVSSLVAPGIVRRVDRDPERATFADAIRSAEGILAGERPASVVPRGKPNGPLAVPAQGRKLA